MLNEKHKAPEGTCVLGGGIERPCKYFLYWPVVHNMFVRNELQEKRVKSKGVFYSCITYPYFVLVFWWAYTWTSTFGDGVYIWGFAACYLKIWNVPNINLEIYGGQ